MSTGAELRVLVVGGGIAGLTTAVALRHDGHTVEVIERHAQWPTVGWGLSLTGPALRALRTIGLDRACSDAGWAIEGIDNCDVHATVLHRVDPPSLLGPGEPIMVGIGRPALSRVLREAGAEAGVVLTTGTWPTTVVSRTDDVDVALSDGSNRVVDLVIAADGVNSWTRDAIGIKDQPVFVGQVVWRTSVPRPTWATRLRTFNAHTHSSGLIPFSPREAYVFTTEITSDADPISPAALVAGMREVLAPLEGEMAAIRDRIEDPARIVRRPVVRLLVEEPWHRGRVVLVGDAAHTCAPHMVSGAALAIEDAVVLAEEIRDTADVEEALANYWHRRLPRARLVVDAAQEMVDLEFAHDYAAEHVVQGRAFEALAAPA